MGGCRCSYRNCTVKTDGKTHMFHYPVFEKVRCHQWLVSAQRLDFLNLKVSQLKNRVICQHHFKEECFMNYKKDKLTFEAIPTEDGPFCDPSKFKNTSKDLIRAYSNVILLEDIENEILNDKKANYSLRYGDFLTNGELIDQTARYNYDIDLSNSNNNVKIDKDQDDNTGTFEPHHLKKPLPSKSVNKSPPQPILMVPPYTDLSCQLKAGNEINQNLGVTNTSQLNEVTNSQLNKQKPVYHERKIVKKEPKVKILSAKKIQLQTPLPIGGTFRKVSPSTTITLPQNHSKQAVKIEQPSNMQNGNIDLTKEKLSMPMHKVKVENNATNELLNEIQVLEELDVKFCTSKLNESSAESSEQKVIQSTVNQAKTIIPHNHLSPKAQKLKSKVTPERTAAIEQKRKFNMKMKDVLESCLDKLDDPDKHKTSVLKPSTRNENSVISSHLARDQTLPNIQEYTLAYLDAGMKRMERTLLNRIEKNSQKIMEIKDSLGGGVHKKSEPNVKRFHNAHTNTGDECYKKYLYQEISKYLSHNARSLVYEELFVNKFALERKSSPHGKKRRKVLVV